MSAKQYPTIKGADGREIGFADPAFGATLPITAKMYADMDGGKGTVDALANAVMALELALVNAQNGISNPNAAAVNAD